MLSLGCPGESGPGIQSPGAQALLGSPQPLCVSHTVKGSPTLAVVPFNIILCINEAPADFQVKTLGCNL